MSSWLVGEEVMAVSHLLFVDNTLLFCDLSKEHVEVLSWAFTWFEAMFGLKINLHKSELIPMGVVPNFEELARVLGYKVSSLPSCYLGILLEATFKSPCVGDAVEERFRKLSLCGKDGTCPKEGG